MNGLEGENLRQLFERFMGPEQAQMSMDDIRKGEQILRQNPAPEPDEMLIANIKAEIALNALPGTAHIFRRTLYNAIAIAASITIITVFAMQLFISNPIAQRAPSTIPSTFWDTGSVIANDNNLANFTLEFERINDSLALISGEDAPIGDAISDLEEELLEIENGIWKG
jgi:hypothetical protein